MLIGHKIYDLCKKMFPYCRSITGDGVRRTLEDLRKVCPELKIFEIPSGTQVFDWTVPKEWNIREAWIKDSEGNMILDFAENNLQVMGYSLSVDRWVFLDELKDILYTQPDQPDAIPYVTSYYKERYGFCMSENQKTSLKDGRYHIYIDSELKPGSMTYGELIIPGEEKEEVFCPHTYVIHLWPTMSYLGQE